MNFDKFKGQRFSEAFKKEALKELGLENHPKAEKVFDLAWERGHSQGYTEVYLELQELADLLLD